MTESPDSPADAHPLGAAETTDAVEPIAAEGSAKAPKDDDEPKAPIRERILRLALITVGAALVASILGLYSQRDDTDPSGAVEKTAEAESGAVTIDIDVSTNDADQSTQIVTRYQGDDYDTTLNVGSDAGAYSSSTSVQQVIVVDGESHYRVGDDGWTTITDQSAVTLDDEIDLPSRAVGWSTDGLATFVDALDLVADNSVVSDVMKASITMAEVRALDVLPLAIEVLTSADWAWRDDQSIDVEVTLDGGELTGLTATAADESPDRVGGLLSISTSTSYVDLGEDAAISDPIE